MKSIKGKLLLFVSGMILIGMAVIVGFFSFREPVEFKPAKHSSNMTGSNYIFEVDVLTWNILYGCNDGFKANDWQHRKESFRKILQNQKYDILCLQEALPDQVGFFSEMLPGYQHVAVGRDDGKGKGEHCPIYFDREKFELEKTQTFWLSDTPDKPGTGWGEPFPRICTWVQLRHKQSGASFRVYNVHMQVNPLAQQKAARFVIERLKDSEIPVILAGDLNCSPVSTAVKIILEKGFREADSAGAPTFHFEGKGIRCLDHILIDKNWVVKRGVIIRDKGGEVYPSDHFGLMARLGLRTP